MSHCVYLHNTSSPSGKDSNDIMLLEWGYEMPLLLQPLLISGGFVENDILYFDAKPGIANLERFYNFLEATTSLINDKATFTTAKNTLFTYLDKLTHPYFSLDAREMFNTDQTQAAIWLADIAFNNAMIISAMDHNDASLLAYNQFKHVSMAFHSFAELLNHPEYQYGWGHIYEAPAREEIYCEGGLWGLKSASGEILLPPQFNEFYAFSEQGIAVVMKGQQYGYVHRSGKVIVAPSWDEAYDFDNDADLAIVQRNGLLGLINVAGEVVVAPQFDQVVRKVPPQGFAWAMKGEAVYLVDKYGVSRANKGMVLQEAESGFYTDEAVRERLLTYANSADEGTVTDEYTPVEELYNMGVDAYSNQDYPSAIYHYTLAAEKGYGYAMNNLAHIYYLVDGYVDDNKAFYWYEQGAEARNTNAINGLSLCYQYGIGTNPDIDKAIQLLLQAAEDSLAVAHNNLGFLLYDTDPGQALYHYQQAEILGEPDYGWLGYLHEEKGDYQTALRYYQQDSSEVGAFNQGNFYLKGLGTAKDVKNAIVYFDTAIAGGYDRGHIELARIYLFEPGFIDQEQAKVHIAAAEKAGVDIPGEIRG